MIFVESPWFEAWRRRHFDDAAFQRLQLALLADPLFGDLIPASGGLRKLRLALPGRGKRGGARLIYYYSADVDRIYLLYAYAKNVQSDLTKEQVRQLAAAMRKEFE